MNTIIDVYPIDKNKLIPGEVSSISTVPDEENISPGEKFLKHVAHVARFGDEDEVMEDAEDEAMEAGIALIERELFKYQENPSLFMLSGFSKKAKETAINIVDKAISECQKNPGVLMSPMFCKAAMIIRTNPEMWANYRVEIKRTKPSGVLLSDIDKATRLPSDDDDGADSVAGALIELVTSRGELFFDSDNDSSYVEVDIAGVSHVLAIGRKSFIEWLSYEYYSTTKGDSKNGQGQSASEANIKQACFALAGIAKHDGEKRRVYLRVADYNDAHYIFLGDDNLRVIEVTKTGWRIINKSPVKFWKPASMQALPDPINNGDISRLWEFCNIPENDRSLVLAWILECWRSETPFPILALSGGQGSAKSSTQSKLRELVDNNAVNLRAAPKNVEDIFVTAGSNWLSSLENISHLTSNMQDALCTLATGGGFASRTLYTNNEETIIEVKRPVIINSIPNVITAQDLTDRSISIELPHIEYREESEISQQWEQAKPEIMGGLLDLFVKTLAMLPKVKLINPPRMADFTRLGESMIQALGHQPGTFEALYKSNRSDSIGRALESSPVAVAIIEMVDKHHGASLNIFYDTVENLRQHLEQFKRDTENWPRSARGLSDVIKRQSPALSALGIKIETGRRIEKIGDSRGIPISISRVIF